MARMASFITNLNVFPVIGQTIGRCAEGGNRTRTTLSDPRILSPVRLPVPPPRHVAQCVGLCRFYRRPDRGDLEKLERLTIVRLCDCAFQAVESDVQADRRSHSSR